MLGFELYKRDVFLAEALVTNPLSVDFLGKEVESSFSKACANPVEPEIAS